MKKKLQDLSLILCLAALRLAGCAAVNSLIVHPLQKLSQIDRMPADEKSYSWDPLATNQFLPKAARVGTTQEMPARRATE